MQFENQDKQGLRDYLSGEGKKELSKILNNSYKDIKLGDDITPKKFIWWCF